MIKLGILAISGLVESTHKKRTLHIDAKKKKKKRLLTYENFFDKIMEIFHFFERFYCSHKTRVLIKFEIS